MPGSQRINSIIDQAAVDAEFDRLVGKLKESADLIKQFPKIHEIFKGDAGSAADMRKAYEDLAKHNQQVKKTQDELTTSLKAYQTVLQQQAQAQARYNAGQSDAAKTLATSREQLRQQNLELKNQAIAASAAEGSIAKMRAQLSLLNREYDTMSAAQRSGPEGQQKLKDIQSLNSELVSLENNTGRYGRSVGNYATAFTGYANTLRGLRGPTKLVGEWLGLGAEEADRFRLVVEHAFQGIAAFFRGKEAKAAEEVKDTVATTANTVAMESNNAATATNTVATEANVASTEAATVAQAELTVATTATSTAMKVLRIAMWATGIGVIVGVIAYLIVKTIEWNKATAEAGKQQKLLNEITLQSADSYGKERAQLDVLVSSLQNEHTPRKQKLELLGELKERYKGYFDDVRTEKDLIDKLPEAYERAAQGILLKAKVEAAQGMIGEQYKQRIQAEVDYNKAVAGAKENLQRGFDLNKGDSKQAQRDDQEIAQYSSALDGHLKVYEEKLKEFADKRGMLMKFITGGNDDILKLGGTVTDKDDKPKKEKKEHQDDLTNEMIKQQQDLLKARAEFDKQQLEHDATTQQKIFENEENSLHLRLQALNLYTEDKRLLNKKSEEEELSSVDIKLTKITEIESKAASKRTGEEKKLLLEKDTLLQQKKNVEQKHLFEVESINQEHTNRMKAIHDKMVADQKKTALQDVEDTKGQSTVDNLNKEGEALSALDEKFKAGKVSVEAYNKEKQKIKDAADTDALKTEEQALEGQLVIYKAYGDDTIGIETKLADVRQKLRDKDVDGAKSAAAKKEQIEKQLQDKIQEGVSKSYDLGVSLIDSNIQKRVDKIQGEIDANNQLQAAETERINNSTLSEQDKAAKLIQLKASHDARELQMEAKKREEQVKQAKFDRDAAVVKTLGEAIAAHFKLVAELGPAGIPLAIANDVLAGIQIASLIAKPLPKFATGTRHSPEGLALTDEQGPELYIKPGGEMFMGSNTPNIKYLERGTEIISYDEVNKVLLSMMLAKTGSRFNRSQDSDVKQLMQQQKDLAVWQVQEFSKTMGKQKTPKVNININGDWNAYIKKQVFE